ncbi:MAG: hypothetical protein ACI377_05330 [Bacteroides fragilis]|jgi:hypothetical protein
MEVLLVEVNWVALFWFGMLILNLIATILTTILDSKVRKEIVRQNQLIMEQNHNMNTLIVRVCSKSVRDRKNESKPTEETA